MIDVLSGVGGCRHERKTGWVDASSHAHHASVQRVLFVLFYSQERIFSLVISLQHILYIEDLRRLNMIPYSLLMLFEVLLWYRRLDLGQAVVNCFVLTFDFDESLLPWIIFAPQDGISGVGRPLSLNNALLNVGQRIIILDAWPPIDKGRLWGPLEEIGTFVGVEPRCYCLWWFQVFESGLWEIIHVCLEDCVRQNWFIVLW